MGKGRKPKPTRLKLLEGNPGRRPLPKDEPAPKAKIPPCPKHLGKVGRKEWRRVTKELATLGLLTGLDRATLASYCKAWERWIEAETALEADSMTVEMDGKTVQMAGLVIVTDKGNMVQSPFVGIANKAMELMNKAAAEFGMTPSARTRVSTRLAGGGDALDNLSRRRRPSA